MIGINGVVITEKMRDAGSKIASDCMDANIRQSFDGLGGSKKLDLSDFSENKDLIEKYLDGDINSVEVIYLAMERARKDGLIDRTDYVQLNKDNS